MVKQFKGEVKISDVQAEFDTLVNRINKMVDAYNGTNQVITNIDYTKGGSNLAPSGYTLDSKPKSITISSTNIANDGFKEIEIVNTKGILLPTTGGRSAMIITIVGMLLIIISIVLLILFAKKTKNKEKK